MKEDTERPRSISKETTHAALEWRTPAVRRRVRLFAMLGLGLCAVFILPLCALFAHAASSDLHSHIILIPVVAGYIVSLRTRQLPSACQSAPGRSATFALLGLAMLAIRWRLSPGAISWNDRLALSTASFICLLLALGFAVLGQKWMRALAFPAALLIFLIPLPDRLVDWLETGSKLASTEAADLLFTLTGTPVFRRETTFVLPGMVMQVAQECSGIRSSFVLFITSLVAANLFLQSTWRRLVLVLVVIPLGIIRNGFRIMVIGKMCVESGPTMIDSWVHHRGGPLFFALSLIPLLLLTCWLRRGERQGTPLAKPVGH
jgi:exosortase C (VPDSG-CTERM-specific)